MGGIKLSRTEIAALDLLIELKREEEEEAAAVAAAEEEGEEESVEAKAFPAVVAVGGALARATPAAARVTARATPRAKRAAKAVGRGAKKAARPVGRAARDVGLGVVGGVGAHFVTKRLDRGKSLSEQASQLEEELPEGLSLEELLEIREQVEEE